MLYLSIFVLLISGAFWLAIQWIPLPIAENDEAMALQMQHFKRFALQVHGASALVSLLVFGSLLTVHIPTGWRLRTHRISGTLNLAALLILISSTGLLWYAPLGLPREIGATLHWVFGLALPILVLTHRKQRTGICK